MKSRVKHISTLLPVLLCFVVLWLSACNNGPISEPGIGLRRPQILILPEIGISDISTFDPAIATDMPSLKAISMIFTGLVGLNNNSDITNNIAQSWSVSTDGLTYIFHLRPNLKFGDGTPLTSADVAYSLDRALQPATNSRTGPYYLRYIKDAALLANGKIKTIIGDSILTPDSNTVVIKITSPVAFFLDTLTAPCGFVVEKSLIDTYGKADFAEYVYHNGVEGPFKVQAYTHNRGIVFVPNPDYYGAMPQFQKVVFPFYKDVDTTLSAYLLNQVDEVLVLTTDYPGMKTRSDFHSIPLFETNYYAMNYAIKPFDNIDIRKAFELAINKDIVVQAAWKGSLIPTNHIVPQGMPGYNLNLTGVDGALQQGDQVKAKTLFAAGMQQEGWTNVSQMPPVTLTYASEGNQAVKNEISIVQQEWKDVLGVSVQAKDVSMDTLQRKVASNRLQFWRSTWTADYADVEDWTTLQFGVGVRNNNMNYGQNNSTDAVEQQQVQQELVAADTNPNPVARLQAYNAAEQSLVNDVVWMPMEQVTDSFLLQPCVFGYDVDKQDLMPPNQWGETYITTASPCAYG